MRTAEFDFNLPPELIAQHPAVRRDESRLLVLHRNEGRVEHGQFSGLLQFLQAGDVLVLNNSRVIPARLRGLSADSGGRFEILLVEENDVNDWWAMLRPGRRARVGAQIGIQDRNGSPAGIKAVVTAINDAGDRRLKFSGTADVRPLLEKLGETPLPPYIHRNGELPEDRERYQTVYATQSGSVAAPTAGLHFTTQILDAIGKRGVQICFVTLHIGPGTFLPVKAETPTAHIMHEEQFTLGEETAKAVNEAKNSKRRVIAVGTTTLRVLETVAAQNEGRIVKNAGKTGLFIHPPYRFRIVDALLTNFHLPRSTLLMLVSAFASPEESRGIKMTLAAYAQAIERRYRFFSYGDAMLLL